MESNHLEMSFPDSESLDSNAMTIESFLEGLWGVVSMEDSVRTNLDERQTCNRCQERSFPWKTGSLKWREIEDGAYNLQCPICQFLIDWLPVREMSTLRRETERPGTIRAVLKIGRLDSYMDKVMSVGSSFDDENTGSNCAFQLAAAWMTTCFKEHSNCVVEMPVLPTRILDVGTPDGSMEPKLYSDKQSRALYFTLSYRWKQDEAADFQTTKANIEAYKQSIRIASLPGVMQDAVRITRRFGIRYLWIDALCIIQDSESDWQSEAKKMAGIYSNSTLTISAASDFSEDHDGIFRPRTRLHTRPFNIRSPWPDGTSKYVFADRRFTKDGARPRSILDKRAWILQEQLLSPRVLSYSNEELYWDCLTVNASESFPGGIPGFYDADLKMQDLRFFKDAVLGAGDRMPNQDRFYEAWKKIVESYSDREITKETDKIAALLGVADAASIMFEDKFLIGLWKRRLWTDLLWWVKRPEIAVRSTSFVAPTWSWASIIAPISYDFRGEDSTRDIRRCVDVIHAEAESDQTIPVLHGKIVLRGRLVSLAHYVSKRMSSVNLPSWKEDMKGTEPTEVRCLIIGFSRYYVYAIGLMARMGIDNCYTRVGRVEWSTSLVEFGWDEVRGVWADGVDLITVTLL